MLIYSIRGDTFNNSKTDLIKQILAGSLYLATGDKYQGDWKDGKRQGKGVYHYKYVNFLLYQRQKCSI